MAIQLAECANREFSERDIVELQEFLSKVPPSHLDSTNMITRIGYLYRGALADASRGGKWGEIRLSDGFYDLDLQEREFTLIHEIGHNYFDFRDYVEGNREAFKHRFFGKELVSHLLRIQWIDLGWELDPKNWAELKWAKPMDDLVGRDKYTYATIFDNPNQDMSEWTCSPQARIPKNLSQYAFRYEGREYSPIEEMADAYALFVLEGEHFLEATKRSSLVQAKYDFIRKCFADEDREPVVLER